MKIGQINLGKERQARELLDVVIKEKGWDLWKRGYKIVRVKRNGLGWLETMLKRNGKWTATVRDTIAEQVHKYFVVGQERVCEEKHTRIKDRVRDYSREQELAVGVTKTSEREIREVLRGMSARKASIREGIDVEQVRALFESRPEVLVKLLDKCLQEGRFVNEWKVAQILWIPKNGGVRPISLVQVLAKLFDRMINRRLVDYLERNAGFSDRQFWLQKRQECDSGSKWNSEVNQEE